MKRAFTLFLLFALSGCEWAQRQADAAGSYIPVIGDRRCNSGICWSSDEQTPTTPLPVPQEQEETPQQPAGNTPFDTYAPEPISY